ncbi:hypothetical protein [Tenacibaculum sp. SZ-18]|nr:hypothetical protein [Tenacibaculum sp. SZ-18]
MIKNNFQNQSELVTIEVLPNGNSIYDSIEIKHVTILLSQIMKYN